jgi:phenylacetate-CoA ligase
MIDRTKGFLDEAMETMDPDKHREYLDRELQKIVAHAYANAPAVRAKLDAAGAAPGDLKAVGDLEKLPVTEKAELVELQRKDPPFGGLVAVPVERLRRIFVSPGPIYEPGDQSYQDNRWAQAFVAAGFRAGDLGLVTFNFNMVPFANMLDDSLNMIGAKTVPMGVGNTDIQVQTMKDLRVNAYLGTPSFLAALGDKAEALGMGLDKDIDLAVGFVAAEMLPESFRTELENRFGMIIRQSYGTADAGCLSYECYHLGGMHVPYNCIVEIVDPDTGRQVEPGSPGEVVCTVFDQTYPLIRFGTGDLSALDYGTCACGRTTPKLTRIMGRVDQVTKVKGMFIHPGQASAVAARFEQVQCFQVVVTRAGNQDVMTFHCELEPGADTADLEPALKAAIQDVLRLRGEVQFVAPGTIPEGAKIIDDRRVWD